jgi:hypothetical protein
MDSLLTPAVGTAVPVWSDQLLQVGTVATPEWPGPITTDHAGGPESYAPGSPSGPVMGTSSILPFFELPPVFDDIPGELGDTAKSFGQSAPIATFDSSAGEPFAPSGPIADTHGFDTGGTRRKFNVITPRMGTWWRRTIAGTTWNKTVEYDPTGKIVSTDNNRTDYDQYQGHDAGAYAPRWIPYSERPVYLNIAHAPVDVKNAKQTAYTPSGDLSPVGPNFWTNQSVIYEQPPDPETTTVAQSQSQPASSSVGFWG